MTGSLTSPPQKGGNLTSHAAQHCPLVGDEGGALGWLMGCQPGVMVFTDVYGELMPSDTSQETLMGGGLTGDLGLGLS